MMSETEYRVVEKRDAEGRLIQRRWCTATSGVAQRAGGPAFEEFDPETGKAIHLFWSNRKAPLEGRRVQINPKTDVVTNEEYYDGSVLHRDDGRPAKTLRNPETGNIVSEEFYFGGDLHRDYDLPAVIEYFPENGQIRRLEYHQRGRLHRLTGPAVVEFDDEGNITHSQYYRDGKLVSARPAAPGLG